MSKLAKDKKFVDLSDYGRPIARLIANNLKNTTVTPVQVTYLFLISGLTAIYCMLNGYYLLAMSFLLLKSILDAADGELARIKNKPSYTGRYLDSIFDALLNLAFLGTICHITSGSVFLTLLAFISMQLQGTVFNFYYVILRHKLSGDQTSQIFEKETPKALSGENQQTVNLLFQVYLIFYGLFDRIIYFLEKEAVHNSFFPKWFMTITSLYGLGFQLLLIGLFLISGLKELIIPFFICYSLLILPLIGIRKMFLSSEKV